MVPQEERSGISTSIGYAVSITPLKYLKAVSLLSGLSSSPPPPLQPPHPSLVSETGKPLPISPLPHCPWVLTSPGGILLAGIIFSRLAAAPCPELSRKSWTMSVIHSKNRCLKLLVLIFRKFKVVETLPGRSHAESDQALLAGGGAEGGGWSPLWWHFCSLSTFSKPRVQRSCASRGPRKSLPVATQTGSNTPLSEPLEVIYTRSHRDVCLCSVRLCGA